MARLGISGLLLVAYAAPLFFPPQSVPAPPAGASLVAHLFPDVPAPWVVLRLVSLAIAAALLSGPFGATSSDPLRPAAAASPPRTIPALRALALLVAVGQAASAQRAPNLAAAGQAAYVLALFLPALLLTAPRARDASSSRRTAGSVLLITFILAWAAWRLLTDPQSPRATSMIDTWRTFLSMATYVNEPGNHLTGDLDPEAPGIPASSLFVQGLPLFQAGLVPFRLASLQVIDTAWLAVTAAGVATLARTLVGPRAALVAVAVFLFAPFTRFLSLTAGPYVVGSLYAAALALCALRACRRRSEAALAALGAVCGIACTHPALRPTVALFAALTAWSLRGRWHGLGVGVAAALASFVAAAAPNPPAVPSFETMAALRDSLGAAAQALLSPFAIPRTPGRLWGDALFDPLGGGLIAVGLASCLRALRRAPAARLLLLFVGAALLPAIVASTARPNPIHALALPVPAALLAAAGFEAVRRRLGMGQGSGTAVAVTLVICAGGFLIFDVVNPRILGTAPLGVIDRVVTPPSATRALVVDDASELGPDVRWLATGPAVGFGGRPAAGYLRYAGGALPDLPAAGKDLLLWSAHVERTARITDVVCMQWPTAVLYEIRDPSGAAVVHAARTGGSVWQPNGAAGDTWTTAGCADADGR